MIQSREFLDRLFGPLLKTLLKDLIKPVVKCVLIPLGFIASASAADVGIHKKNVRIG